MTRAGPPDLTIEKLNRTFEPTDYQVAHKQSMANTKSGTYQLNKINLDQIEKQVETQKIIFNKIIKVNTTSNASPRKRFGAHHRNVSDFGPVRNDSQILINRTMAPGNSNDRVMLNHGNGSQVYQPQAASPSTSGLLTT